MTSADAFERAIKKATTKGIGSSFKKAGRTAPIAAALRAYEESVSKNEAQAEQAAYLYQVIKNCRAWSRIKADVTGGNTANRRRVVVALYNEAQLELRKYPIIVQLLDRYARKKAGGVKGATPLAGVYAHEGAAYKGLKANGQFVDPGQPRFAPSASLISDSTGDRRVQSTAFARGERGFKELTFEEYMEIDRLLESQYRVLYLSKLQRLEYMVAVENGRFRRATDGALIDMPGQSVAVDMGQGEEVGETFMYACDRYGSLFLFGSKTKGKDGKAVQLNHSTFLAGNEVLCAGTISIKKGLLRGASNLSGHYQPNTAALTAMLTEWQRNDDVNVDPIVVVDMSLNIITLGKQYMAGGHGDRREDRLVKVSMRAVS